MEELLAVAVLVGLVAVPVAAMVRHHQSRRRKASAGRDRQRERVHLNRAATLLGGEVVPLPEDLWPKSELPAGFRREPLGLLSLVDGVQVTAAVVEGEERTVLDPDVSTEAPPPDAGSSVRLGRVQLAAARCRARHLMAGCAGSVMCIE